MFHDEFPCRSYGVLARRRILEQSAHCSRKRLRPGDLEGPAPLDEEPRNVL
jgi:hypothetical protein